ncbi:hypothetical protein SCLCIDRAFT_1217388 [Scleroderma citrinum Foug A]|uniref:Uncharacterized protein n=1 Tax=Scleroderma citrinum Foug A TaxID=1036808 RepID=A0A0C2ZDT4_9AGAM|nr:hypothetical protein SCLCIDRAFT_1217388 [Scleroderma citrinum Foug A]
MHVRNKGTFLQTPTIKAACSRPNNKHDSKHELLYTKTPTRCIPTTAHLLELPCGVLDARCIQFCDHGSHCRSDGRMIVEAMKMITGVITTWVIAMNTAIRR